MENRRNGESCKGVLLIIWEDLTWSLLTGPVFSLRELGTDLKNTDFHFQNLVKTTRFCSKTLHKHYISENCDLF